MGVSKLSAKGFFKLL